MVKIKWFYYEDDNWQTGPNIERDKISEYNVSAITSMDVNFNIREPRTCDITIVDDAKNDNIQNFINKCFQAMSFKTVFYTEIDESTKYSEDKYLDILKIRIQIYDGSEKCIFKGFLDRTSLNKSVKEGIFSFSAIDNLYLYKMYIEDAGVNVAPHNGKYLERDQLSKILLNNEVNLAGNPRKLNWTTGLDDTSLYDLSDIRDEVKCDGNPDIINLKGFPVMSFNIQNFHYNVKKLGYAHAAFRVLNTAVKTVRTVDMDPITLSYDTNSNILRQFNPYKQNNFDNEYIPDGSILKTFLQTIFQVYNWWGSPGDKQYSSFWEFKEELYHGFRATADQGFDDNYGIEKSGVYFFVYRHSFIKIPIFKSSGGYGVIGNLILVSLVVQERMRFKIKNKVVCDPDENGYVRSNTANITPVISLQEYQEENYLNYPDISYPNFTTEYLNLKTELKKADESQEIVYFVKDYQTGNVHEPLDQDKEGTSLYMNNTFSLFYTGPVVLDEYNFGGEEESVSMPAKDLLKLLMFTTGSYIYHDPTSQKIKINSRFHTLWDFNKVIELDTAIEDNLIIEKEVEKHYHAPYDSQALLQSLYHTNMSLINAFNRIYELVFRRDIVQKRIVVHDSALYSPHGGGNKRKIVSDVKLENIIKINNKYHRVMSIEFEEENSQTYILWEFGKLSTPIIIPYGGVFSGSVDVVMVTREVNVTIRYTTNGSDPTESSTQYTSPISISSTTTIKAKGFHDFYEPSFIKKAVITIT